MRKHSFTNTKSKATAGQVARRFTDLRAWMAGLIARHHARVASLRVYSATRQDRQRTPAPPQAPALQPAARRVRKTGAVARILNKLVYRIRNLYAAHEARLIALRVYDKRRG